MTYEIIHINKWLTFKKKKKKGHDFGFWLRDFQLNVYFIRLKQKDKDSVQLT